MAQIIDLGKLRFVWNGTYNSGTTYELNDLVKYGANVYVYTNPLATAGTLPTTTTHWDMVIGGTFPDQTDKANYILQTNGTVVNWTHTPILEALTVLTDAEFKNDIAVTSRAVDISSWTMTSSVATVTTSTPHFFNVNDVAVIDGLEGMSDGPKVITATPTPLTLSFVSSGVDVPPSAVTGATATVFGNISTGGDLSVGGNSTLTGDLTLGGTLTANGDLEIRGDAKFYGDIEFEHDVLINGHLDIGTDVYQVTAKQVVDNVATLTLSTYAATGKHGVDITDKVDVAGVGAPFDGTNITLTAVSDTTISYAVASSNIANTASSGTATIYGHLYVANDAYVSKGGFFGGDVVVDGETELAGLALIGTDARTVSETLGLPERTITAYEIVDGVATITTSEPHGYSAFLFTTITMDIPVAAIDGEHEIVDTPTATTFTIDVTGAANVAQTSASGSSQSTLGFTNPIAIFTANNPDYSQVAIRNSNSGAAASSDFLAYADNGDDFSGWIDMGITSSGFGDPEFTITGPNDGYIFMSAPAGTTGEGNLVLATGGTGTANKIIFAAGGLDSNATQMEITPNQNVHIEISTESTSPTTGALTVVGGVGIQGNLNIQGNVDIEGTITFGGEGTTVETSNLAVTDPMVYVGTNNSSDLVDLSFIGEYAETLTAPVTVTITNKALTSNVATLTYSEGATAIKIGDYVTVTGVDATFNGTFLVTAVTATTFSYAKTASNVTSAAVSPAGSAVANKRRRFSGISRDASDGVIKAFKGATTKPVTTVDFTEAGISMSDFQVAALSAMSTSVLGAITQTGSDFTSTFAGAVNFNNSVVFGQGLSSSGNVAITGRLDVQEIREDVIDGTIVTNVLTADYSTGNIFYLTASPSANFTVNLTNAPVDNGKTISLTLVVPQGATGYIPSAFQVAGVAQTLRWPNGTAPTPTSSSGKIDIFAFQLIRRANAWVVLGSATTNF